MPRFIVEDQAHRALVMALLDVPKKEIELGTNRGKTCKLLAKNTDAIGLVDEDPRGPGLPKYLQNLPEEQRVHDLKVFRDLQRNNLIIVFCPNVEVWVFDKSRRKKVDLLKLAGTDLPSEFHKTINQKTDKWVSVIRELEIQKSEALSYFRNLLI